MGSLGTLERKDSNRDGTGAPSDCYLSELHRQLSQVGHSINWLVVLNPTSNKTLLSVLLDS